MMAMVFLMAIILNIMASYRNIYSTAVAQM
jgi:hypothetical protein